MRRLRLALTLLTLVVLCVAFSAQAAYANTESGYVTWTAGPPNNTPPLTPHAGYATTTQKCAVCHAVHKAPADGELLLRGTVGESCTYCHITSSIGLTVVYGGVIENYTTEDDHGHQSPAVTCIDCHAVHGANTFLGDKTIKILKVWGIQQTFLDDYASGEASAVINAVESDSFPNRWDPMDVVDAAFCTQCHPYYSDASETTVTADITPLDGSTETTSFKTHPLKMPGGEDGSEFYQGFVARGSSIPTENAVAVYSTRGCYWSCHGGSRRGDGAGVQVSSYPHYDPDTVRFLQSGENRSEDVVDSSDDSNCLMCHVWDNTEGSGYAVPTTGGVGISY
jgi:predicted CXXCH cytochrome family protein